MLIKRWSVAPSSSNYSSPASVTSQTQEARLSGRRYPNTSPPVRTSKCVCPSAGLFILFTIWDSTVRRVYWRSPSPQSPSRKSNMIPDLLLQLMCNKIWDKEAKRPTPSPRMAWRKLLWLTQQIHQKLNPWDKKNRTTQSDLCASGWKTLEKECHVAVLKQYLTLLLLSLLAWYRYL